MVVSSSRANEVLRQVHVVPITTADRRRVPTAVELFEEDRPVVGFAMADSVQMIDQAYLGEPIGELSERAMRAVGYALMFAFDLE